MQVEKKIPSPGDVVLTTYGVATVVKLLPQPEDVESDDAVCMFKARLWREPGKSVGSSATAFMRYDSIQRKLPAAPGMITSIKISDSDDLTQLENVMVHRYSPWNDSYFVSKIEEDSAEQRMRDSIILTSISKNTEEEELGEISDGGSDSFLELTSEEVLPSKRSKFYPLIEELIIRGNEASAAAKKAIKSNPTLSSLASIDSENSDKVLAENESSKKVNQITSAIKETIPDKEEIHNVYKLLKDEELTVLLEKGQKRLRQLVSSDIPKAREDALLKMGVEVGNKNEQLGISDAIVVARKEALDALDKMLTENLDMDMETIKTSLGETFGTMFDSLTAAANSDTALNSITNDIYTKTSEWQEQTGRILETRSSNLFFEGAQRLQSRVENFFTPGELQLAQQSSAKLTKAFSEGDAAVARLKSIELGDSIRSRLIRAIEIRSDSEGGLDAIIAGAINTVSGSELMNGEVQSMITNLENSVSSKTSNAHESLISLLSESSSYQDVAIMRLEQVLVDLEDNLDEELSAEDLAALARGDGGTEALFAPIARNAAKEINKQLDTAESSVSDPTILNVLSHVRRIMSGELTMSGLVDEIATILNDDEVVKTGENIAQTGESILDFIENASENNEAGGMMAVVEKAGLNKETVLGQIENLDVDTILDTAEGAYSDESKRQELLSSATDSALDFLLRILPSMPIPAFEGVREGLIYSIADLSMHGFKVKKEDIMVEIAGIKAAEHSGSQTKTDDETSACVSASTSSARQDSDACIDGNIIDKAGNNEAIEEGDVLKRDVKATELLIIDVRNISAIFEKASWSFEQTYLPYLKGSGLANAKITDGRIRLQFELRKKQCAGGTWEPVLCLHKKACTIGNMDLTFEGKGRMTWIINKLAAMLRNALRDYVVRVILNILSNSSGWLLENLNNISSNYWDLILKTAGLTMNDLVEASEDDIIKATANPQDNEIDLVWADFVPLGINLMTKDKSGFIKVVDFPRGSQARRAANKKNLNADIFMGSKIIAVNGTRYDEDEQEDVMAALRDPARPKTVKFELVSGEDFEKAAKYLQKRNKEKELNTGIVDKTREVILKKVDFSEDGPLGIKFTRSIDNSALVIDAFNDEGCAQAFEKSGTISEGDLLTHVNGEAVIGENDGQIDKALILLEKAGSDRPLSLCFVRPYHQVITVEMDSDDLKQKGGIEEIVLTEKKLTGSGNRIHLKNLKLVDGVAEDGGVVIGDRLIFINGNPVGSGRHFIPEMSSRNLLGVESMLQDQRAYPVCFTFARPNQAGTRMMDFDSASSELQTINIVATCYEQLGFQLYENNHTAEIIVQKFNGVPGYLQRQMRSKEVPIFPVGLTIDSIDDQTIPSYATCDIVMNAMKRNWKKNGKVKIVFCDDNAKKALATLIHQR